MNADQVPAPKICQNSTGRDCFLRNSDLKRRKTLTSETGHKTGTMVECSVQSDAGLILLRVNTSICSDAPVEFWFHRTAIHIIVDGFRYPDSPLTAESPIGTELSVENIPGPTGWPAASTIINPRARPTAINRAMTGRSRLPLRVPVPSD